MRDYLRDAAAALEAAGVDRSRICVDPGPGLARTPSRPSSLCATSTRSCIWAIGHGGGLAQALRGRGLPGVRSFDRDVASAAEALLACELGASVVRTHCWR